MNTVGKSLAALLVFVFAALSSSVALANHAPVGFFSRIDNTLLDQGGTLSGAGWAADYEMGAPVDHITLKVDGVTVSAWTSLNGVRADVQANNLATGNSISPLDVTHSGWAFSYNIGTLSLGSHTAEVLAWDNQGLSGTLGSLNFSVVANHAPVGSFSRIDNTVLDQGGTLTGAGWAADYEMGAPVDHLTVKIDGVTMPSSTSLNGVRADVQANNVANGNSISPLDVTHSGWTFAVNIGSLAIGNHTAEVLAWDNQGASGTTGTMNFTVVANHAPVGFFSRIDNTTIAQNGVLTGAGWAADYEMGAPVDHLTLNIDGTQYPISISLNGVRADVQANNVATGNSISPLDVTHSGWTFACNIGALSVGSHTAEVFAWDNQGLSGTLGSLSFTVSNPPIIFTQPKPVIALVGDSVQLTTWAYNQVTDVLNYQWYKNGSAITGNASATTSTLTLSNVQTGDAADYYVVASNSAGSTTSNTVHVTVQTTITPPTITSNPSNISVTPANQFQTFRFTVTASGVAPLSYQWQISTNNGANWAYAVDDVTYSGASDPTLVLKGANLSNAFDGQLYRCVVTTHLGTANARSTTSASATLRVSGIVPTNGGDVPAMPPWALAALAVILVGLSVRGLAHKRQLP